MRSCIRIGNWQVIVKTSINLERMITLDAIALDVSNGRSYVVYYSDNTCLFEGWMHHNQEGLNGL